MRDKDTEDEDSGSVGSCVQVSAWSPREKQGQTPVNLGFVGWGLGPGTSHYPLQNLMFSSVK